MTTADRVHQAAAKIRETANAATPGRWTTTDSRNEPGDPPQVWQVQRSGLGGYGVATCRYRGEANRRDAEHIALMSPPVALVIADWLDETAADKTAGTGCIHPRAIDLTNLILRDAP